MNAPPGIFPPGSLYVSVTAGQANPPAICFPNGTRYEPIRVGRQGTWPIEAPGIGDVHAFLFFDGTLLFIASANLSFPALVNGYPMPAGWTQLVPPCEVTLGSAKLKVYDPFLLSNHVTSTAGLGPSLLTPAPMQRLPELLASIPAPPPTQRTGPFFSPPGAGAAGLGSVVITEQPLQIPAGPATIPRGMAAPPPALREAFLHMLATSEAAGSGPGTRHAGATSWWSRAKNDWNQTPTLHKILAAAIPLSVLLIAALLQLFRSLQEKPVRPLPAVPVHSSSSFLVPRLPLAQLRWPHVGRFSVVVFQQTVLSSGGREGGLLPAEF